MWNTSIYISPKNGFILLDVFDSYFWRHKYLENIDITKQVDLQTLNTSIILWTAQH